MKETQIDPELLKSLGRVQESVPVDRPSYRQGNGGIVKEYNQDRVVEYSPTLTVPSK